MKQTAKSSAAIILALLLSCVVFISCGNENDGKEKMLYTSDTVIGTGDTQFTFICEHKDGTVIRFTVNTNKTVLSEALSEVNLIEGENSTYGLYVKKVNGITHDYDTDHTYWALYVDDAYAQSGVDSITINTEHIYKFKAE